MDNSNRFYWKKIWKIKPKIELERPLPLDLLKPFLLCATLMILSVWFLLEKETLSMKFTGPIKVFEFQKKYNLFVGREDHCYNIISAISTYDQLYIILLLCTVLWKIFRRLCYGGNEYDHLILFTEQTFVILFLLIKITESENRLFDYSDKRSIFYVMFLLHNIGITKILNSYHPLPIFIIQISKLLMMIFICIVQVQVAPFILTYLVLFGGLGPIPIGPIDLNFAFHMDKYILWNPIKEEEIPKFLKGHGKFLYFCSRLDQPFAVVHAIRLVQISVLFGCVAQTKRIETMALALLGLVFGQITKIQIRNVTLCKTNVSMLIGLAIYILDECLRNFLEINPFLALFYWILALLVLLFFAHFMVICNGVAFPEINNDLLVFFEDLEEANNSNEENNQLMEP